MAEEKRKRPRFESHTSGISNLSTYTQSTQLSSDKSDESDETEDTRIQGPRRVSNTSSQSGNHRKHSNPAASRKRTSSKSPKFNQESAHASFYLENDAEQNVFNFENVPQSYDNARQAKAKLPPRVRRNTAGDIHSGVTINHDMHNDIDLNKYMHRSHTSSCWSVQQNEQRVLSNQPTCAPQIQQSGACMSELHHQKCSPCTCQQSTHLITSQTPRQMVAALHGNQNSNTNIKTAIFHESNNALQSGNSGYIKPLHCENTYSSIPSAPDSAYIQVERGSRLNSPHRVNRCCPLSICDTSLAFYKRGFIVMFVINIILILLNCIGLPFVYTWTHLQQPLTQPTTTSSTPFVGALTSGNSLNKDVSCRQLQNNIGRSAYVKLLQNDVIKQQSIGVCRIESILDLIQIVKETTIYRLSNGTDPCIQCDPDNKAQKDRLLMVAKPASTAIGNFTDNKVNGAPVPHTRILWMQRAYPNIGFDDIIEDQRSLITIPKTGYYFIFSRIHYKRKPQNQTTGFAFALGHSVVQVRPDREDLQLAEVSQKCFSNDINAEHTSILETVEKLTEGEKLYVKLSHAEMFDETDTQHSLGMFLVSN